MRAATAKVTKAKEAVRAVAGTPEFDVQLQKSIEIAYKKLKKSVKNLERQLADAGVISE